MASAAALSSPPDALLELVNKANSRRQGATSYEGEVTPAEAFSYLAATGGVLVDVRTVPEWQFVGVPDLTGCKGRLAMISWKVYPDMAVNPEFLQKFEHLGVGCDTPLFFICRGGSRSSSAAERLCVAGYRHCFNVATGFEGEPDERGHRGRKNGWQGSGLPWKH